MMHLSYFVFLAYDLKSSYQIVLISLFGSLKNRIDNPFFRSRWQFGFNQAAFSFTISSTNRSVHIMV